MSLIHITFRENIIKAYTLPYISKTHDIFNGFHIKEIKNTYAIPTSLTPRCSFISLISKYLFKKHDCHKVRLHKNYIQNFSETFQ